MLDTPILTWVVLPALIFCARVTDVGLSTLRILFIAQGRIRLAPAVGFLESLIWLGVISQILPRLGNPVAVVAYAGGFAAGNSVGIFLERRLAMGMQVVRIITQRDSDELTAALYGAGYGVTSVEATGAGGSAVKLLFTVVRRRAVPEVLALARRHNPRAFLSVEDVRQASEGTFPDAPEGFRTGIWPLWRGLRKIK